MWMGPESVVAVGKFSDNNTEGAFLESFIYLTDAERTGFTILFSILLIISVVGNVAGIAITFHRNHRFVQKISLISLALGDLCMTIAYCLNNMETFSHYMINWTLGAFLCSFVPFAQIFGLALNLVSVVVFSIDRYINVVKVVAQRWNPSTWRCLLAFGLIWIFCAGISYPISQMFGIKEAYVIFEINPPVVEIYSFCVTSVIDQVRTYYISIATFVFVTLWGCLLYLNYQLARLVWSHRKPFTARIRRSNESFSNETTITQDNTSPPTAPSAYPNQTDLHKRNAFVPAVSQAANVRIERKIRTFKIIVTSICIFTICRLPFWAFNIAKLSFESNSHTHWILMYCFNALALANCAIDPFLYFFLRQTIKVIQNCRRWLNDIGRKLCCWCCREFDEFENDNPFRPISNAVFSISVRSKSLAICDPDQSKRKTKKNRDMPYE